MINIVGVSRVAFLFIKTGVDESMHDAETPKK